MCVMWLGGGSCQNDSLDGGGKSGLRSACLLSSPTLSFTAFSLVVSHYKKMVMMLEGEGGMKALQPKGSAPRLFDPFDIENE